MSDNNMNEEKQQEDKDGKSSSLSTKTDEQEEDVEVIWDTIVGSHIRFGKETVSTIEHIQDNDTKEFILFYFSAKWCPPCQTFTPILIEFYHTINNNSSRNNDDDTKKKPNKKKQNRIEIIYIPSDRNVNEFEAYYTTKMPWYAIDVVNTSTKKSLAEMFHITSIPTLIVLDAKTGLFVTSDARTDIMKHRNNNSAIIDRWRSITPVSIEIGLAGPAEPISPWQRFLSAIISNPVYLFLILYMAKNWYQHYMKGNSNVLSPGTATGDQHLHVDPNPHGNEFDDEF